jgi:mannose-6-phosphate isomerase-like protein (cupin superfamily)
MAATGPEPISVAAALGELSFLADRTPTTTDEEAAGAFALLADYRDGGIFVGHWAGRSEWERHGVADEIVVVLEGETTITFRTDEGERSAPLRAHDMVVVPKGTWHRFDTPDGVRLFSVTPQPTEHRAGPPD